MSRAVPAIATQVPGNPIAAALENTFQYAVSFLSAVPVFSGYQVATQSVATGTWTSMNIDTERLDSDAGHSTVTNTSRYIGQTPGTYLVFGTTGWVANATGVRRCRIALNGSPILGSAIGNDAPAGSTVTGNLAMTFVTMNGSTDYVEVQGQQGSGGALSTNGNADFSPSLQVLWVSA